MNKHKNCFRTET